MGSAPLTQRIDAGPTTSIRELVNGIVSSWGGYRWPEVVVEAVDAYKPGGGVDTYVCAPCWCVA